MKDFSRRKCKKVDCWFMLTKPWAFVILLLAVTHPRPHSYAKVEAKKSIPHSKETYLYSTSPAWNHSPRIGKDGFLTTKYKMFPGSWEKDARIGGKYGLRSMHTRNLDQFDVVIRQVPGDGNCLFHSLSTALSWVEDRTHLDFDESFKGNKKVANNVRKRKHGQKDRENLDLFTRSSILRQLSVDALNPKMSVDSSTHNPKGRRPFRRKKLKPLFLQGSEFLRHEELLEVACSQYDLTADEYCESMRKSGVWGGGPEIVALCNYLRRPIHVYELMAVQPTIQRGNGRQNDEKSIESKIKKPEFRLRRMALFGSPKFDNREPLHILSADCRFPDIEPGQQAAAGNHFMAMFVEKRADKRHRRVRTGASDHTQHGVRVRSGGRDRVKKIGENTFSRREVIAKYLQINESSHDESSAMRLMTKMKNMFLEEYKNQTEVNIDTHDNPIQAVMKWCNDRRDKIPFGHQ